MGDIDDFQSRIDEVKAKSHRVIDANGGQPKVKDEVESQLSNLEDSYMSLQATALQIKVGDIMFSFTKRTSKKTSEFIACNCWRYSRLLILFDNQTEMLNTHHIFLWKDEKTDKGKHICFNKY